MAGGTLALPLLLCVLLASPAALALGVTTGGRASLSPPTPPNPYLVFGYVETATHAAVSGAPVWVNDTTQGFSLQATTDSSGRYQVDLSSAPSPFQYAVGDAVQLQARNGPLAATNSTVVFAPPTTQSWCNATLGVSPLTAGLSVRPSFTYVGGTVNASATASGGIPPYSYNWSFGDGSAKILTDVHSYTLHTYLRPGTFQLNVTLNGTTHGNATASQFVPVLPQPLLVLAVAPSSPQANTSVELRANLSVGGHGWIYFFSFGDGSTSGYLGAGVNLTFHAYSAPGTYPANVTAYNATTRYVVQSAVVPVTVGPGISAALSAAPSPTEVGVNTTLTASSTNSHSAVSYVFAYGDGGVSASQSGASIVHVYATAGAVHPSVTATNLTGATATGFAPALDVLAPLEVSLSATPASGPAPLTVSFVATPTGGVGSLSYTFNLGDGTRIDFNTTGQATTTYPTAGTYVAIVLVVDALGARAVATSTVTVGAPTPLTVTANANVTSGVPALMVGFVGTAQGGTAPYVWSWNFGDGSSPSAAQDPSHTYNTSGKFIATLTVADSSSPAEKSSSSVTINVGAVVPLAVTLTAQQKGPTGTALPFNLTITGGEKPFDVFWLFADGTGVLFNTTYGRNLTTTHAFAQPGTYVVTVIVNDSERPTAGSAQAQITVVVAAVKAPANFFNNFLPGGSYFWLLLVLLLVIVVILLVVALVRRRKKDEHDQQVAAVAAEVTAENVRFTQAAPPPVAAAAAMAAASAPAAPASEPTPQEAPAPSGEEAVEVAEPETPESEAVSWDELGEGGGNAGAALGPGPYPPPPPPPEG